MPMLLALTNSVTAISNELQTPGHRGRLVRTRLEDTTIIDDIEDFIRLHRTHGRLVGDATEPPLTGHRVTIECPCGVMFIRHVMAGEAIVDLPLVARLELTSCRPTEHARAQ